MSTTHAVPAHPLDPVRRHPLRWLALAAIVAAGAGAYAYLRVDRWEASQALLVRNEATGAQWDRPGKFRLSDEMKTSQETVLELAKNEAVLSAALEHVGPAADAVAASDFPTALDVAQLREAVKVTPPKGSEFGTTEIFYLTLKDADGERALKLIDAVTDKLENSFQQLRDSKAASTIDEIRESLSAAEADWRKANERLAELEHQVGSDLDELRTLSEPISSHGSNVRRKVMEIESELRQAKTLHANNVDLQKLVAAAQEDPGRLLASPSRLLDAQPGLKQLKTGLIEAQIRTAAELGNKTPEHPDVQAAQASERAVSQHLHDELAIARRGVEADLRVSAERVEELSGQVEELNERLKTIVSLRPEYTSLTANANQNQKLVEDLRRALADARASQLGARAASLITRLDAPRLGSRPLGPSRAMIIATGVVGGLAFGIGAVLLLTPPKPRHGEAIRTHEMAAANWAGRAPARSAPRRAVRSAVNEPEHETVGAGP